MKKKYYIIISCITILVILIVYLAWPEKKISTPDTAISLDTSVQTTRDFYLSEENFEEEMNTIVIPYLDEYLNTAFFNGYDGNTLYCEQYLLPESKGHIVISHGFTDGSYKYKEVIYYFLKEGYSVSIMDHRSHGYSYRSNSDLSIADVDSFDEYVKDFNIFIEEIVRPAVSDSENLYVYAHSMGGGIATLCLEQNPDLFDAAILTAPMMEIEFGGLPNNLSLLITNTACMLGLGDNYIVGSGPFSEEYSFGSYSINSEARYAYMRSLMLANDHFQVNGGSFSWLKASIKAVNEIKANASSYTTDTLLFQAGDDHTVGPNGQNYFVKNASNVQLIIVEDTKHTLFYSENDVLIPYMDMILDFYNAHEGL